VPVRDCHVKVSVIAVSRICAISGSNLYPPLLANNSTLHPPTSASGLSRLFRAFFPGAASSGEFTNPPTIIA
jgi:hypothetical protein